MTAPLVSIIVPVYATEQYITTCLESIRKQTFVDLEILCIDDASPDNCTEIIECYSEKDPRFRVIQHTENLGLAAARNTGLGAARGEYVFFLDSDDLLFSSRSILHLYETAKRDFADEVIGGILMWNEKTEEREYGYHKKYLRGALSGVSFESALYLINNVIACNKLFRLSFLKKNNITFNEDLRKFEDNPVSWKVHLLASSISVCDEVTYLYRQRDPAGSQSIMQQTEANARYHRLALDDLLAFLAENPCYNHLRHLFDKYVLWWMEKDVLDTLVKRYDDDSRLDIIVCYRDQLSCIPESSQGYFSSNQKELFRLMQAQQYEKVLQNIKNTGKRLKKESVNDLQRQLDSIRKSTTWRITAPLRAVACNAKKMCNKLVGCNQNPK